MLLAMCHFATGMSHLLVVCVDICVMPIPCPQQAHTVAEGWPKWELEDCNDSNNIAKS